MASWTVEQVGRWLTTNGLKKHVTKFRERNIDGTALLALTDEEIAQLFSEVQDDGTVRQPTIGTQSRFRQKLMELKSASAQEEKTSATIPVRSGEGRSGSSSESASHPPPIKPRRKKHGSEARKDVSSMQDSHQSQSHVVEQLSTTCYSPSADSEAVVRQFKYIIDGDEHVPFFANPKFLSHFIHYVQQKTVPIAIDIVRSSMDPDRCLVEYTLNLTGTNEQYRIAKEFIKKLLQTVQVREYTQRTVRQWLVAIPTMSCIQDILDHETDMFTVCRATKSGLAVLYFKDDQFNNSHSISTIDDLIEHQVVQEKLFLCSTPHFLLVEYLDPDTCRTAQTEKIHAVKPFRRELNTLIHSEKGKRPLISISKTEANRKGRKGQTMIEIFGHKKLVNPFFTRVEHLFRKYRLKQFKFTQLSSTEMACLNQIGSKGMKTIENGFSNDGVKLDMDRGEFYAPKYLADDVESRVRNLLATFKRLTFDASEFYYDVAEKSISHVRQLARNNRCHCKIRLKTKLKPYPILRTSTDAGALSTPFESLPFVACQAQLPNGSIEVCIADIAEQRVDVLIIPSMTSGLKEHLVERAGDIKEQHPTGVNNSMPFITETTAGRLHCREILFVNWSPPGKMVDEEVLSQSVRFFISSVIQHALNNSRRSLAIAMPDVSHHDQILAEEMLDETVDQIRRATSHSLHVSFIFSPDQQNLHRQFTHIVQTLQTNDTTYGNFYCPTSTATITLTALSNEDLTRCETKINRYFERSMIRKEIADFDGWNQELVNGFYAYCREASVLPQINDQQQMVLLGPITNVHQAYQKFQFTNVLALLGSSLQRCSRASALDNFRIVFSYALQDSQVCQWLRTRLISEGFSVWMKSDPSGDTMVEIDRADLLILCLSEHYFGELSCVREAKYGHQAKKNILPIQLEYCQLMGSLRKVVEKQTCLSFSGSAEYLNLQFDKLLLIILQQIGWAEKDNIMKRVQANSLLHFLLTPEQRQFSHDKRTTKLVKCETERIEEEERRDLIRRVERIIEEEEERPSQDQAEKPKQAMLLVTMPYDRGISALRQWIDKVMEYPTRHNLPPFTYTGDFNDAPFPTLDVVAQYPSLSSRVKAEQTRIWTQFDDSRTASSPEEMFELKRPVRRTKRVNPFRSVDEQNSHGSAAASITSENDTMKKYEDDSEESIVEETTTTKNVHSSSTEDEQPTRDSSLAPFTYIGEIRGKLKNHKSDPKTERDSLRPYSADQKLECKRKFAERMRNNETAFDKFCREHRHRSKKKKKKIKTDITAIFTPSPFSTDNAQPRNALQFRPASTLPLKFVWNGVQDECIRKSRLNMTSVLFFREPTSAEN